MADYVVSTWDEFLQHNTSGDTVKFANPHEVNGEIVLEGNGTQNNPYIVSTYEEMLFATGATYIWQVKLINREEKLYKYNDIYCHYDDILSTIDFNLIQPEGYTSDLIIYGVTDFNGWTLKNIFMNSSTFEVRQVGSKNAIISNFLREGFTNHTAIYAPNGFSGFIISMMVVNDSSSGKQDAIYCYTNEIKNSSVAVRYIGYTRTYGLFENCKFYFDVQASDIDISSMGLKNTLVTGKIETTSANAITLGGTVNSTIFDLEYSGNGYLQKTGSVNTSSFYNVDKITDSSHLTATNLYAATTRQLKSAQWLCDRGFPIGVDT